MTSTPIPFQNIRGILLDIEGTTSSISFVYDEMFPFVRRELESFLDSHWSDTDVQSACQRIVADADDQINLDRNSIRNEVFRLMDGDVKATGLKSLQGLIWKSGFESGELVAHVYDDVVPALKEWKASGIDIRIYSSGSIAAQKLFFGHTEHGSLLDFLSGHYDTTTGPKQDAHSYRLIASKFDLEPDSLLFLSDVEAEIAAAKSAGWQTCLTFRPGNTPPAKEFRPVIESFFELKSRGNEESENPADKV